MTRRRVAIVHEWFVNYAGSERVVEQMIHCFPEADLFATVDWLPESERGFIQNKPVATSFIQRLPWARTKYRSYFPLMPLAVEQFDLSEYDLVISSSHAVSKGVVTGPDQLHICMCYSPVRYAWDLHHQYLRESGLDRGLAGWLARWTLHKARIWDTRTANGVDRFIAISDFIARRIRKAYRRESSIVYPPVDISGFSFQESKADFYLAASRMVPYKRMPMIVEAFSGMPDKKLIVIGEGPDFEKCRAVAGPNVQLLGWQPFAKLKEHMQHAKAFVFAAEEDFGIAPLEAQACGTPVIAFAKGGLRETVQGLDQPEPTGVFFHEQTIEALQGAVTEFELHGQAITPQACRKNALRFSPERFRAEFTALVEDEWQRFQRHGLVGHSF